jgi:hypothetical protein
MTQPVTEHDQPYIRSPFRRAAPTFRVRRARAQDGENILIFGLFGQGNRSVRLTGSTETDPLLGLFSLITLWSHKLHAGAAPTPRATSWYRKSLPTFSDALAAIRRDLWSQGNFEMSISLPDLMEIPETTINSLIATACYAA